MVIVQFFATVKVNGLNVVWRYAMARKPDASPVVLPGTVEGLARPYGGPITRPFVSNRSLRIALMLWMSVGERQPVVELPEQARTAGSKRHPSGLAIIPSTSPSAASQAASWAL